MMLSESEILKKVDAWKLFLHIDDWTMQIVMKPDESHADNDGCEAEIEDELKYHDATLILYREFFTANDMRQELIIAHELVHLLLARLNPFMGSAGDDALEEVVQNVAMLFFRLRFPPPPL